MRTSNKFTFVRIVASPIFFLLYFVPIWTGVGIKFSAFIMIPFLALSEITDYLDGHFARKHNEVSDFGKLFDPFADMIEHLTTFVCFLYSIDGSTIWLGGGAYMQPVILILIMYREFSMIFLRMIAAKKGTAIAARKGGKAKTVLYVVAGFYALLLESLLRLEIYIGSTREFKMAAVILFALCAVASYVSFIDYIIHFKHVLKDEL